MFKRVQREIVWKITRHEFENVWFYNFIPRSFLSPHPARLQTIPGLLPNHPQNVITYTNSFVKITIELFICVRFQIIYISLCNGTIVEFVETVEYVNE